MSLTNSPRRTRVSQQTNKIVIIGNLCQPSDSELEICIQGEGLGHAYTKCAVIISTGPALSVDVADLKFPKTSHPEGSHPEERPVAAKSETNAALHNVLQVTERQQILQALKQSNWVVAGPHGATARLGMNRSTLQVRIRKLGISSRSE